MIRLITLALLAGVSLSAQARATSSPLGPLLALGGEREGRETRHAGAGKGERTYALVVGGRYLRPRNRSRFEPREKNPKGEVYEDRTVFSHDRRRKRAMIRQFNSEGLINEFVHGADAAAAQRSPFSRKAPITRLRG